MAMDPTIIDPAALARLEEWGGLKLSSEIISTLFPLESTTASPPAEQEVEVTTD